ncbi:hypothetical protein HYPSUDRAFT_59690 [Hypholoma sublateritium FD-334 SS-4]|uniref:Uncharacterized protein n=1 Tax=Hypholoma sublateritium (strain FD-334 SS-4) TaxID=945553 RepID=A0A0D2LSL9_HYPSF|nr:hypothetical protein HYPSUDRAFT_59690 [Hypholoma sublateritium FD-334 SS-4]
MADAEDPGMLSPMECSFSDLYDGYDFFAARAAPSTNSPLPTGCVPQLNDLWNSPWPSSASLAAGSFGGTLTSHGSNIGANVAPSASVYSLSQLFVVDPHPQARKQVSLTTLYDDRRIKKGVEAFKKLRPDSLAERLVRPKFRDDIASGGDGIWLILDCLCHETDQRLAVDFLTGTFIRPSKLAAIVVELLGANLAFQALYEKHSRSPIAVALANNSDHLSPSTPDVLFTSENLPGWDYQKTSIDTDPVVRVLKRDLITFISERYFTYVDRIRSSLMTITTTYETVGATLLGCDGCHGPRTRSTRANEIHRKIYPKNRSPISLGPSEDDIARNDKNFVKLYCSASTMAAANTLVDTVGPINIALGTYRKSRGATGGIGSYDIPWETMPFASMLVEVEIKAERNASLHGSAAREGVFSSLRMFSRIERDMLKEHIAVWKRLRTAGNPFKPRLDKLLNDLDDGQDLCRIAPGFLEKAMPLNTASGSSGRR